MINFRWRHFQKELILMAVRWYLAYALSYRDIEELMVERGVQVDHATLNRWVIYYAHSLKMSLEKNINETWVTAGEWMRRISK